MTDGEDWNDPARVDRWVAKDARRPVRSTLWRSCDAASVVSDRVAFWSALAVDQGRDVTVSIDMGGAPSTPVARQVAVAGENDAPNVNVGAGSARSKSARSSAS